ncbi:MAG: hypothetical protein EHM32_10150 [Spirochaetales bacterium]|nr:MAG: hypothetical protein EHM32_10150 [Spirochaetales bacterium]
MLSNLGNVYKRRAGFMILAVLAMLAPAMTVYASDLSDATHLRERCEKEIKALEVPVRNFGDASDLASFAEAEKQIKLGKVKFIQTKYQEAIVIYNEYLKIQAALYRSLAKKYVERTDKLVDGVGVDLVDHVDDQKVEKYMQMASQNLKDAKTALDSPHPKGAIDLCRTAKNYALSAYKLVGKAAPAEYDRDAVDNGNSVYGK